MIRQPIRLVAAFLLAAVPFAPLFASGGPHGRPFAGDDSVLDEGRMDRFADHQAERLTRALDLTAAQQVSLGRLQETLEAAVRPLAQAMRAAHEQLRTLLEASSPDPMAVGTQAIAIDRARDEMRAARDQFETDFAAILTDTQRTVFHALQEMRPEGERFGRRGGDEHGRHRGGAAHRPR